MTHRTLNHLAAIAVVCATASSVISAVGNGLPFIVNEDVVPGAIARSFNANSLDFTYHSCGNVFQVPRPRIEESGYFFVSSYRNPTSVVDSQINYYQANGYRIYGVYRYVGEAVNFHKPSPSGPRLNYVAATDHESRIDLYLDELSNTRIDLQSVFGQCAVVVEPGTNDDDFTLGSSSIPPTTLNMGEKSEASNVAANGDFELRFGYWTFGAPSTPLFQFEPPAVFYRLVVNANVTRLIGGALNTHHRTEGSGNLFWWPQSQS